MNAKKLKQQQVLDAIIAKGDTPFTVACLAETLGIQMNSARGHVKHFLEVGFVIHDGWETIIRRQDDRDMRGAIQLYRWTGKTYQVKRHRTAKWKARQFVEYL